MYEILEREFDNMSSIQKSESRENGGEDETPVKEEQRSSLEEAIKAEE